MVIKGFTNLIVQKIVKHGGGSIMVWRCMTAISLGLIYWVEGKMNKHVYRQILEAKLYGIFTKYCYYLTRVIFHNNGPKHTTITMKGWLIKQSFCVIKWLLQTPNLNPIKQLWVILKWKLNNY